MYTAIVRAIATSTHSDPMRPDITISSGRFSVRLSDFARSAGSGSASTTAPRTNEKTMANAADTVKATRTPR